MKGYSGAVAILCCYVMMLITFSCLGEAASNQCGHQNGGRICPEGLCCSHDGYCGKGEDYCRECQNNCPNMTNPVPQCGTQSGGMHCPFSECCSQYGFCGHTDSYCGEGCQSNCTKPGYCPVDDHQCGAQNGGRICPEGYCCSKSGYCGTTDDFCGSGCQNNCPNPVPECGPLGGNRTCPGNQCCSEYGFCGNTVTYCSIDCFCESNCWQPSPSPSPSPSPPPPPAPTPSPPSPTPTPTPTPGDGVSSIITKELFEEMLLHRNDNPNCAIGFYTYEAFIEAADSFEGFGTTGDLDSRKRELAAFFGQTSHETTGGSQTDYTWGYCYNKELNPSWDYCSECPEWPCAPGKKYYGRGPIQISYNCNYGPCGQAINYNLLNDPDKAETDPITSFKTAIWFWMTPQPPKPSCHNVMIGQWTPSPCDQSAGRVPGYGVVTNIINGGVECGMGPNPYVENRIGYYKRYCDMLGVSYGDNLDCYNQKNFNLCSGSGVYYI